MRHIFASTSLCASLCLSLFVLAACSEEPSVRNQMSEAARRAAYPRILPLHELLAGRPAPVDVAALTGDLTARAAALRARAARLRAPIVDTATRTRMQAALARH